MGEDLEAPLEGGGAQSGDYFVLVGESMVVAAMIGKQHVHDGTGDEDDDCRQQDGEPKSSERNQVRPP